MLAFGVIGLLFIYYINPFLTNLLYQINPLVLKTVVSVLSILFLIDVVLSTKIIYNIKGVGLDLLKDSTEEINKKVKEVLSNKGLLSRRLVRAFPEFKLNSKLVNKFKKED